MLVNLAAMGTAFLIVLVWAWAVEVRRGVTCSVFLGPPKEFNGYLELQLRQQHPIEPTFDSQVFVYSVDSADGKIESTVLTRSADRTYGQSFLIVPLTMDAANRATRSRQWQEFGLVAETGLHRHFPFDSATFNFELSLKPRLSINVIRVTNRVPGFVCSCDRVKASVTGSGSIRLSFGLQRSPLIQLTAIVLVIASMVFIAIIFRLGKIESLATSVASFFISMWSLRNILGTSMKTFPTLFDCAILTLCMLVVVALCWKTVINKLPTIREVTDKEKKRRKKD
jgi:hypothetical protein